MIFGCGVAVALATACAMEFWARLLHGRVWHGLLWRIHRSHHRPRHGRWEANDLLSFAHAPIAVAFILVGCTGAAGIASWLFLSSGIGMTMFGIAYFVIHDGLVHGRLPVARIARLPYFERVRRAHEQHHVAGGAPYGLFAGPWEKSDRRAKRAPSFVGPLGEPKPSEHSTREPAEQLRSQSLHD